MDPAGTDSIDLAEHRAGRVRVYLNPHCTHRVPVEELVRLPDVLAGLPGRPTRQPGCTTSWRWRPAWAGADGLVVRLYAHGGLLGPVLGTRFLSPQRMLNELRIGILAHRRGVPTAVPVAVRIERTGPFLTAHYVSEALPEAVDMLSLLRDGAPPTAGCRRLAASAASAIAAMHDAGIWHADLSLANLLVQGTLDDPRVFVIDFDKAEQAGAVALRRRVANLLRLDRSVLKWPESRRSLAPRDRLRFLRAYARRCTDGYPRDWREVARRCGG